MAIRGGILRFAVFGLGSRFVHRAISTQLRQGLVPSRPFYRYRFFPVWYGFFLSVRITVRPRRSHVAREPQLTLVVACILSFRSSFFRSFALGDLLSYFSGLNGSYGGYVFFVYSPNMF